MNKLSKEKRDKLILVCIVIVAVVGALYTFVLGAQKEKLAALETQITGMRGKLSKAETSLRSAEAIEASLASNKTVIEERQQNMAPPGQYYYWFLKLIDQFRKDEKLDTGFIVDITQPEFVDAGILPNFPYKAASFGLRLNGQFHEIGKFIAELENRFPYFRVQNVKLALGSALAASTSAPSAQPVTPVKAEDKLIVEVRIITLVKPGTT
jgi:Tfp pilus assembly protein PilO